MNLSFIYRSVFKLISIEQEVVVSCFVHRIQREEKGLERNSERAGTNIDKRYFYHPSFSCISLDGFERKSVSMLSIFCLELRSSS
jgi:hypothetical protein